MTVHVRRLRPNAESQQDIEEAAQWLVDSFAEDPIMSPCVGGELHLSTNLWRAFIKAGLLGGEVYVAGVDSDVRVDGVAVWFAPGTEFLGTEDQRAAWYDAFGKHLNDDATRFWDKTYDEVCNVVLDRVLGNSGHHSMWHLQLLGHMTERAKETGMRLETFTDTNVTVYSRLGFANEGGTATLRSPQGDALLRCMFMWPESRTST